MTQQRTVINKGKRLLVNCPSIDDGVGAGFATGQLVMKSMTDGKWYVVTASGSAGNVQLFVSQSALPFKSGPIYQQLNTTASIVGSMDFYEQNFPYQIVGSNDGKAYAVYLTGTAPTVTFVVSQSAWGPASITAYNHAVISLSKPNLILQSITDGNYYALSLTTSASGSVGYTVDTMSITADNSLITSDNSGSTSSGSVSLSVNQTPLPSIRPIF